MHSESVYWQISTLVEREMKFLEYTIIYNSEDPSRKNAVIIQCESVQAALRYILSKDKLYSV